MQRQVETWRNTQIIDDRARLILYSAFEDGKLDAPKSLLPASTDFASGIRSYAVGGSGRANFPHVRLWRASDCQLLGKAGTGIAIAATI